jgi:hypothetical protein
MDRSYQNKNIREEEIDALGEWSTEGEDGFGRNKVGANWRMVAISYFKLCNLWCSLIR